MQVLPANLLNAVPPLSLLRFRGELCSYQMFIYAPLTKGGGGWNGRRGKQLCQQRFLDIQTILSNSYSYCCRYWRKRGSNICSDCLMFCYFLSKGFSYFYAFCCYSVGGLWLFFRGKVQSILSAHEVILLMVSLTTKVTSLSIQIIAKRHSNQSISKHTTQNITWYNGTLSCVESNLRWLISLRHRRAGKSVPPALEIEFEKSPSSSLFFFFFLFLFSIGHTLARKALFPSLPSLIIIILSLPSPQFHAPTLPSSLPI